MNMWKKVKTLSAGKNLQALDISDVVSGGLDAEEGFTFNGPYVVHNILISSCYTILDTDYHITIDNSETLNIYLPATSGDGRELSFKNVKDGQATLVTDGTDMIDTTSAHILQSLDAITLIDTKQGLWVIK